MHWLGLVKQHLQQDICLLLIGNCMVGGEVLSLLFCPFISFLSFFSFSSLDFSYLFFVLLVSFSQCMYSLLSARLQNSEG